MSYLPGLWRCERGTAKCFDDLVMQYLIILPPACLAVWKGIEPSKYIKNIYVGMYFRPNLDMWLRLRRDDGCLGVRISLNQ